MDWDDSYLTITVDHMEVGVGLLIHHHPQPYPDDSVLVWSLPQPCS